MAALKAESRSDAANVEANWFSAMAELMAAPVSTNIDCGVIWRLSGSMAFHMLTLPAKLSAPRFIRSSRAKPKSAATCWALAPPPPKDCASVRLAVIAC